MAIEPRIAKGPRLSGIPLPERSTALIDGAGAVVDSLAAAGQRHEQADDRIAELEQQAALRAKEDAQRVAIANGAARLALDQANLSDALDKLRTSAAPGAVGHEAQVQRLLNDNAKSFFETLGPDEEVRTHFKVPMAQLAAATVTRERDWQRGQSAKAQGEGVETMLDAGARAILAAPRDEAGMKAQLATSDTIIAAMTVEPDKRAAIIKLRDKMFRAAQIDGLENAGDTKGMRALAADPSYMGVFDADYADKVLDRARLADDATARAVAAKAKADADKAKDSIDAAGALIDEGGIVSQKDAETVLAQGRAAGVDADVLIRFEGKMRTQAINRQFGAAADPDGSKGRAELLRLNALARQRPLTSDENMNYQRLEAISGKRREDDAALLKPFANKDVRGDLGVLAELDKRPQGERFDLAEKVRPGMGYYGRLRTQQRQWAVEGYYELKANPDLIKVASDGKQRSDPTKAVIRAHLGPMAGEMTEESIESLRGVANALYVKFQKDEGSSSWNPSLYARAINYAAGAYKASDGSWRGGIGLVNGRHVWLPDWGSASWIETALARHDYSDATYDGRRVAAKADILKNFTPVLESGGDGKEPAVYILVDAKGGALKDRRTNDDYRVRATFTGQKR